MLSKLITGYKTCFYCQKPQCFAGSELVLNRFFIIAVFILEVLNQSTANVCRGVVVFWSLVQNWCRTGAEPSSELVQKGGAEPLLSYGEEGVVLHHTTSAPLSSEPVERWIGRGRKEANSISSPTRITVHPHRYGYDV